jgi:basic membrane protein A and related proteins
MDLGSFPKISRFKKRSIKVVTISLVSILAMLAVSMLLIGTRSMSAQASIVKVGLILNGEINKYDWNWQSMQALSRAEAEFGVLGTVYTSTQFEEIFTDTRQCAMDGNNLCIGVGWMTSQAISETAAVYSTTKFANVDVAFVTPYSNTRSILFSSQDVGYLAGTLAALMSGSNSISAVCGMEIPTVTAFTDGYNNGARCAKPEVTTIISFTNSFTDPVLGAQIAQAQIALGSDVVFGVGGTTGDGGILTATQSGVWGIGVDTDQFYTLFMSGTVPGSDLLLSSAMKKADTAVYLTISDVVSGTFTSGLVWYGLGEDGVGLAPFHETAGSIPSRVSTQLDWVKRAIIGGSIDPLDPMSPCLVIHKQYLPITQR